MPLVSYLFLYEKITKVLLIIVVLVVRSQLVISPLFVNSSLIRQFCQG